MKKTITQILILICLVSILILPYFVFAQDTPRSPLDRMKKVGEGAGYEMQNNPESTFATVLGTVVGAFLGLLGIIFIILIIMAGYNWMTAGGDEEKVRKAKSTISRAIIGLLIVISAYAIWTFIFVRLIGGGGEAMYAF